MSGWTKPVAAAPGTPYGKAGSLWASGKHTGLDFPAPTGTPVAACAPGRVIYAGNTGGSYGIQVKVRHRAGLETWYCHLSSLAVRAGDQVAAGETIGAVGATGNVTGPHLHLEVRVDGQHRDPAPYLAGAAGAGPTSPTFPGDDSSSSSGTATPAGLVDGLTGALVDEWRGLVLTGLFAAGGFALLALGASRAAAPAVDRVRDEFTEAAGDAAQLALAVETGGASTAAGKTAAKTATKGTL